MKNVMTYTAQEERGVWRALVGGVMVACAATLLSVFVAAPSFAFADEAGADGADSVIAEPSEQDNYADFQSSTFVNQQVDSVVSQSAPVSEVSSATESPVSAGDVCAEGDPSADGTEAQGTVVAGSRESDDTRQSEDNSSEPGAVATSPTDASNIYDVSDSSEDDLHEVDAVTEDGLEPALTESNSSSCVYLSASSEGTYTLAYVLTDGGTWTVDTSRMQTEFAPNTGVLLPSAGYVYREGYHLIGWSDTLGGAVLYAPGYTRFRINADTTFYTVWAIDSYDVTYVSNTLDGSTWSGSIAQRADYNTSVSVQTCPMATYSYNTATMSFDHWSTDPNDVGVSYGAGDTLLVKAPVALYAIWKTDILESGTVGDNPNVYWELYADGTLEMGLVSSSGSASVYAPDFMRGSTKINKVVTNGRKSQGKIKPTTLFNWFRDCPNMSSFDGSGIDTTDTTVFAGWLEYTLQTCNVESLAVTGTGDWVTTGMVATGSEEILEMGRVFHDQYAVRPLSGDLDIHSWTMLGDGILTPYPTFTFGSAGKLSSITLGDDCRLSGTQFSHEGVGVWLGSDGWHGSSQDLMNRYQDGTTVTKDYGVVTYVWFPGGPDGNDVIYSYDFDPDTKTVYNVRWSAAGFLNPSKNVWWRLVSGTLEMGIEDPDGDVTVSVYGGINDDWYGATTPWAKLREYIVRINTMGSGSNGKIKPTTLRGWFEGCVTLEYFDGAGLDTSACTSFAQLFDDAHPALTVVNVGDWDTSKVTSFLEAFDADSTSNALTGELDIHGWDMTRGNVSGMFLGSGDNASWMDSITTLILGDKVVLTGSGFSRTNDGAWLASGGLFDGRHLRTAELVSLYGTTGARFAIGQTTWIWVPGYLGGTFASNPNVWWTFDTATGTLEMGVFTNASTVGENSIITENYSNLPFATHAADITSIVTDGTSSAAKIKPRTLDWRLGLAYASLASFDGSGFDTSLATSFANMFLDHAGPLAVTNVGSWDTSNVTSFSSVFDSNAAGSQALGEASTLDIHSWNMVGKGYANAFRNATSVIDFLVLGDGCVLTGASFNHADDGAWYATNGGYAGRFLRTPQLVAFYGANGAKLAIGDTVWQWYDGYMGGTFASNDNVWWKFEVDTGKVLIGTYDDGTAFGETGVVTESGGDRGNLPFEGYYRDSIKSFSSVATDLAGNATIKVKPTSLRCWLRYYPLLESFDGSGMDVSAVTDMFGFLQHIETATATSARTLTVSGVADWDVSSVTDMNALLRDGSGSRLVSGTLDIGGWDMRGASWSTWPIFNTGGQGTTSGSSVRGLSKIILSNNTVLIGTAFAHEGTGYWKAVSGTLSGTLLSSQALVAYYPRVGNTNGVIEWEWIDAADLPASDIAVPDGKSGVLASNPNIWWKLDETLGALSMGVIDPAKSRFFTEYGASLPWYGKVVRSFYADATNGKIQPYSLEGAGNNSGRYMESFDGSGIDTSLAISLYSFLDSGSNNTFELKGTEAWDTSRVTTYTYFADGSQGSRITGGLDISSWNMVGADVSNFLSGNAAASLKWIRLGDGSVLVGTGFSHDYAADGVWLRDDRNWHGSTADLIALYAAGGNMLGKHVYVWFQGNEDANGDGIPDGAPSDASVTYTYGYSDVRRTVSVVSWTAAGTFDSNPNVEWHAKDGAVTMNVVASPVDVTGDGIVNSVDFRISEGGSSDATNATGRGNLPFDFLYKYIRSVATVSSVSTEKIVPLTMNRWFRLYPALYKFDGAGLDVSLVSDMYAFLASSSGSSIAQNLMVTGVEDWNTSSLRDARWMFADITSSATRSLLGILDLSGWDLTRANVQNMFYGPNVGGVASSARNLQVIVLGSNGVLEGSMFAKAGTGLWQAESGTYRGGQLPTSTLYYLYQRGGNGMGLGSITWTFVEGLTVSGVTIPGKRGVFASNPNVWWDFDNDSGTLTIGVYDAGRPTIVTEGLAHTGQGSDLLPWLYGSNALASGAIKRIVTAPESGKPQVMPWDMYAWFCNSRYRYDGYYSNLVYFDGSGLDTSHTRTMVALFRDCAKLETIDGVAGWDTGSTTDFREMFMGCSALKSLDISNWDDKAYGDANPDRSSAPLIDSMFTYMSNLDTLTVGEKVVLTGTGLTHSGVGVWLGQDSANPWHGNTAELQALYPAATDAALGGGRTFVWVKDLPDSRTVTYRYDYDPDTRTVSGVSWWVGGTFANPNVWWFLKDGKLNLGVTDASASASREVTEHGSRDNTGGSTLPWFYLRDFISSVATSGVDGSGNASAGAIQPLNLESWFEGYKILGLFDGSGFDTSKTTTMAQLFDDGPKNLELRNIGNWNTSSVTSFYGTFESDLTVAFDGSSDDNHVIVGALDLHDWDMTHGSVAYAFSYDNKDNMDGVTTLILGNGVVLQGSGFARLSPGVWACTSGTYLNVRVTTEQLLAMYRAGGNDLGIQTWTWIANGTATVPAGANGVFMSNPNIWWKIDGSTLVIGAESASRSLTVAEYGTSVPWNSLRNNFISFAPNVTNGKVAPINLSGWFSGCSVLETAKFEDLNLSGISSLANALSGTVLEGTLPMSSWNVDTTSIPVSGLFAGTATSNLSRIVLDNDSVLEGTGFTHVDGGYWVASGGTYNGRSVTTAQLIRLYPAAGNDLGATIWNWATAPQEGVFASNDNIWWKYDATTGALTIGAHDASKSHEVTEYGDKLPWNIWNKKITSFSVVDAATKGKIQPASLQDWFHTAVCLTSFDGSGLDVQNVTNMRNFLFNEAADGYAAVTLNITGVSNWETSKVTDMTNIISIASNGRSYLAGDFNISGWDMSKALLTGAFGGGIMDSVGRLVLGSKTVLAGSSFYHSATEAGTGTTSGVGVWRRTAGTMIASSDGLRQLYPKAGNPYGEQIWVWDADVNTPNVFASNPNVRWDFNAGTGKITLSIIDPELSRVVTETGERLPWYVERESVRDFGVNMTNGKVEPTTLYHWFLGNSFLSHFDGKGLDVSGVTDFSGMFTDTNLTGALDVASWGWDLRGKTVDNMFSGTALKNVTNLTVNDNTVLAGTGIANADEDGAWRRVSGTLIVSSPRLMQIYPSAGNDYGVQTWYWDTAATAPTNLFASNPNIWWTMDDYGNLTIGAFDTAISHVVTEDGQSVPWAGKRTQITSFASDPTYGKVEPTTMSLWFEDRNAIVDGVYRIHFNYYGVRWYLGARSNNTLVLVSQDNVPSDVKVDWTVTNIGGAYTLLSGYGTYMRYTGASTDAGYHGGALDGNAKWQLVNLSTSPYNRIVITSTQNLNQSVDLKGGTAEQYNPVRYWTNGGWDGMRNTRIADNGARTPSNGTFTYAEVWHFERMSTELTAIDFTGVKVTGAVVSNILEHAAKLEYITVDDTSVLAGTGLSRSGVGSWVASNGPLSGRGVYNSTLQKIYSASGNSLGANTWTWTNNRPNTFESNYNVWWKLENGALTIGAYDENQSLEVSEYGDSLPWAHRMGEVTSFSANTDHGMVQPLKLDSWFATRKTFSAVSSFSNWSKAGMDFTADGDTYGMRDWNSGEQSEMYIAVVLDANVTYRLRFQYAFVRGEKTNLPIWIGPNTSNNSGNIMSDYLYPGNTSLVTFDRTLRPSYTGTFYIAIDLDPNNGAYEYFTIKDILFCEAGSEGGSQLSSVDLTGLDCSKTTSVTNEFRLTPATTLKLKSDSVLTGAALSKSGGAWAAQDGKLAGAKLTNAQLVAFYGVGGNEYGPITWNWAAGELSNVFGSNANVWWNVDASGNLTIGAFDSSLSRVVTENGAHLPWADIAGSVLTFDVDESNGRILPKTLDGWFSGNMLTGDQALPGTWSRSAMGLQSYTDSTITMNGANGIAVLYTRIYLPATDYFLSLDYTAPFGGMWLEVDSGVHAVGYGGHSGSAIGAIQMSGSGVRHGSTTFTVTNAGYYYLVFQLDGLTDGHTATVTMANLTLTSGASAKLTAFDGHGLDLSQCSSAVNALTGVSFTGNVNMASWDWDTRAINVTNMLAISTGNVDSITLDNDDVLLGTNIRHNGSGAWVAQSGIFAGKALTSAQLMSLYPQVGNSLGTVTWKWDSTATPDIGTFASNANVWWTLDASGNLIVGAFDPNSPLTVTETGTSVPWYSRRAEVKSFSANSANGKVAPTSMASWFAGASNLATVDLSKLDLSATTSLNATFSGTGLTGTLDLTNSNFDFTKVDLTNMLAGTAGAKLTGIKANGNVILAGTGLTKAAGSDGRGAWKATNSVLSSGFTTSTAGLVTLYLPTSAAIGNNGSVIGDVTWIWDATATAPSIFASNANVWWSIDADGKMTLGSFYTALSRIVTETGFASSNGSIRSIISQTSDDGRGGKIQPLTMENWFYLASMYSLFDGKGIDTSLTTSMHWFLCMGGQGQGSIINVHDWDTTKVTDMTWLFSAENGRQGSYVRGDLDLSGWDMTAANRSRAFANLEVSKLDSITLGNKSVLAGTDFAHAQVGVWLRDDGQWFSNAELVALYPAAGNSLGVHTYVWFQGFYDENGDGELDGAPTGSRVNYTYAYDPTTRTVSNVHWTADGVFGSNSNVWWRAKDGALELGVTLATGNRIVTEGSGEYGDLPFEYLRYYIHTVDTLGQGAAGDTWGAASTAKIVANTLYHWFRLYPEIVSFDGRGLELVPTLTNMSQFLESAASTEQLARTLLVKNVSDWDVSSVTNFYAVFYNHLNRTLVTELDISGWDMTKATNISLFLGGDDSKSAAFNLPKIILGQKTLLAGSSIAHNGSGYWRLDNGPMAGTLLSNLGLADYYPIQGNQNGVLTWIWVARDDASIVADLSWAAANGKNGLMPSNPNIWWNCDADGNLTLGVVDVAKSHFFIENGSTLPWYGSRGNVKTFSVDQSNGKVQPYSLASWLTNTNLYSFDGSGVDTSLTVSMSQLANTEGNAPITITGLDAWDTSRIGDFTNVFEGYEGSIITSGFDISSWDMVGGNVGAFLAGSAGYDVKYLTLGNGVVLVGAGFQHRNADIGVWLSDEGKWFSTAELIALYPADGNALGKRTYVWYQGDFDVTGDGVMDGAPAFNDNDPIPVTYTYTYDSSTRTVSNVHWSADGIWASNPNVWWYVHDGIVETGVFDASADRRVTEYGTSGDNNANGRGSLPFDFLVNFVYKVNTLGTQADGTASAGLIQPTNMSHWLRFYPLLTEFDGSGLDVSGTTSMRALLAAVPGNWYTRRTVNLYVAGVEGWDVSSVTDMDYLFYREGTRYVRGTLDLSSWDTRGATHSYMFGSDALATLETLRLGQNAVLIDTDLSHANAGYWMAGTDGRFVGTLLRTATLKYFYPKVGTDNGTISWTWVADDSTEVTDAKALVASQGKSGCFDSNPNVWWKLDDDGNLTIGAFDAAKSTFVTDAGGARPWNAKIANVKTFSVDYSASDSWSMIRPYTMNSWLSGASNLTTFDGSGIDTTLAIDLSGMFYNDAKLVDFVNTGHWNTERVTNFSNMFYGCTGLSTIDLAQWDMIDSTVTNMFSGASNLKTITVGEKNILASTAMTHTGVGTWLIDGTYTWNDPFHGLSHANLMAMYPASGATISGTRTFIWNAGTPDAAAVNYAYDYDPDTRTVSGVTWWVGGTFANPNVWWRLKDGHLEMGVTDAAGNRMVTEAGTGDSGKSGRGNLPFDDYYYFITDVQTDGQGAAGQTWGSASTAQIQVASLDRWFRFYPALAAFDGSGLDTTGITDMYALLASVNSHASLPDCNIATTLTVSGVSAWNTASVTDMRYLFFNDHDLRPLTGTLDLCGWNMGAANLQYAFGGSNASGSIVAAASSTKNLDVVILGGRSVLFGSSFDHANSDLGTWRASGGSHDGSTTSTTGLVWMYAKAGNDVDVTTWTWDGASAFVQGYFPSNPNVWWRIDEYGNLVIGVVDSTRSVVVQEYGTAVPWYSRRSEVKSFQADDSQGIKVAPANLSSWFEGYTNMTAFDGDALDTSNTTSIQKMLYNTNLTATLDVNSWGWDMSHMVTENWLGGTAAANLPVIIMGVGGSLSDSGINHTGAGAWVYTGGIGDGMPATNNSLKLIYPGLQSNWESKISWSWDTSAVATDNIFKSTPNVWWSFDSSTGTLTIGSYQSDLDLVVTEYGPRNWDGHGDSASKGYLENNLPFYGYAESVTRVITRKSDDGKGGRVAPRDLSGWFAGSNDHWWSGYNPRPSGTNPYGFYNLQYFDGTGFDTTNTLGFRHMFRMYNDSGLSTMVQLRVVGMDDWNTGNVTDASNMFLDRYLIGDLDISSWTMTAPYDYSLGLNVANLDSITVSDNSALVGCRLTHTGVGMWYASSGAYQGDYFDSNQLMSIYPKRGNDISKTTYVWKYGTLVTFSANGGEGQDFNVFFEQGLTKLVPNPKTTHFVREGYVIYWWNTTQGATSVDTPAVEYNTGSVYVGGVKQYETLYAIWVRDVNATIQFTAGSPEASGHVAAITSHAGDDITLPGNGYTRPGYDFIGWSYGGKTYAVGSKLRLHDVPAGKYGDTVDANGLPVMTVTAVWRVKTGYVVNYDLEGGVAKGGGSSLVSKEGLSWESPGSTFLPKSSPETFYLPGYDFLGWTAVQGDLSTLVTSSTTYGEAMWMANGGVMPTDPALTPSSASLRCASLSVASGGTSPSGSLGTALTLYAAWTPYSLTVGYAVSDSNGGTLSKYSEFLADCTTDHATGTTATASAGWHFSHWTVNTNDSWTSTGAVSGSEISTLSTSDIEGPNIGGINPNVYILYTPPSGPAFYYYVKPVTFTAVFVRNDYNLHFYDGLPLGETLEPSSDAVPTAPTKVTYGTYVQLPAYNLVRKGYTFTGWRADANMVLSGVTYDVANGAVLNVSDLVTLTAWARTHNADINLYAQWSENEAEFTYKADTGGTVSSNSGVLGGFTQWTEPKFGVVSGTPFGSIAVPDDGYEFFRWVFDATGDQIPDSPSIYPADTVYPGAYTTVYSTGGKTVGRLFFPNKTTLGIWPSSMTFRAEFRPISYTVEFDPNGGSGSIGFVSTPGANGKQNFIGRLLISMWNRWSPSLFCLGTVTCL